MTAAFRENETVTKIVRLDQVRILVLFGGSHLFGQERANIEVIRTLCSLGVEARFITNGRHGHEQIEPELKRWGFSSVRAPFGFHWTRYMFGRHFGYFLRNLWGIVGTSWRLFREAWSWKPTHVYTMNWNYFFLALPAIQWLRQPLVFRAGDTLPQHTRFHRWVVSQLRKHVSLLICNSQFVARSFSELGFAPSVIYNYAPDRQPHVEKLEPARIEGATVLVYIGQIAEHKGVALLVETVITLIRAGRNVMLWIAGESVWNDPSQGGLEKKVAAEALADRIQFLGWVEDVLALLRFADIHVCPSIWDDPSPNVIFEAKKAGVPTVAFPSGGIPELIEDGVDGLLCADTTAAALAASLDRYILNPAERLAAGRAAKVRLEQHFGYERFRRQWAEVFLKT